MQQKKGARFALGIKKMKAIAILSAASHLQYFTLFPFSRSVTLAVQIGVKLCHQMCVKWNKCDSVFQYDNVIGEL